MIWGFKEVGFVSLMHLELVVCFPHVFMLFPHFLHAQKIVFGMLSGWEGRSMIFWFMAVIFAPVIPMDVV